MRIEEQENSLCLKIRRHVNSNIGLNFITRKAGSTQRYYIVGGIRRRGKTRKHRKVVGFTSASIFPEKKRDAVTKVEPGR